MEALIRQVVIKGDVGGFDYPIGNQTWRELERRKRVWLVGGLDFSPITEKLGFENSSLVRCWVFDVAKCDGDGFENSWRGEREGVENS